MKNTNFDRWAGARRNRLLRNISLSGMGISLLLGVVVGMDSIVSQTPLKVVRLLAFGALFVVSFSFASFYHFRIMSRE